VKFGDYGGNFLINFDLAWAKNPKFWSKFVLKSTVTVTVTVSVTVRVHFIVTEMVINHRNGK
jgi:hypothetical protein